MTVIRRGPNGRPRLSDIISRVFVYATAALTVGMTSSLASLLTLPSENVAVVLCCVCAIAVGVTELVKRLGERAQPNISVSGGTREARRTLLALSLISVVGTISLLRGDPTSRSVWLLLAFSTQSLVCHQIAIIDHRYLKRQDRRNARGKFRRSIAIGTGLGALVSIGLLGFVSTEWIPIAMVPPALMAINRLKCLEINFAPLNPRRFGDPHPRRTGDPKETSPNDQGDESRGIAFDQQAKTRLGVLLFPLAWITFVVFLDVIATTTYAIVGSTEAQLVGWLGILFLAIAIALWLKSKIESLNLRSLVLDATALSFGLLLLAFFRNGWTATLVLLLPCFATAMLRPHSFIPALALTDQIQSAVSNRRRLWVCELLAFAIIGSLLATTGTELSTEIALWAGLSGSIFILYAIFIHRVRGKRPARLS